MIVTFMKFISSIVEFFFKFFLQNMLNLFYIVSLILRRRMI